MSTSILINPFIFESIYACGFSIEYRTPARLQTFLFQIEFVSAKSIYVLGI